MTTTALEPLRLYKVHILTKGFESPNGIAFLFPFIVYRKELLNFGIQTQFFTSVDNPKLCDSDVLFIESRTFSHRWQAEGDQVVLRELSLLAKSVPIVWFDISDSTGWLQPQVLPFVRWYCKAQLLRDRSLYMKEQYGNRIWADYYHRLSGITDSNPARSRIIKRPEFLNRLRVSWNSGLANYTMFGPHIMGFRKFLPLNFLLRAPKSFTPASSPRTVPLACRMGTNYERHTVAHQRKQIQLLLKNRLNTAKVGRRVYYREMQKTRLVISPFGLGEITLKDFEATLCGAALLKPDVSHMETWPNLFISGQTVLTHSWDLSDFLEKIEEAAASPQRLQRMAQGAQETYRQALEEMSTKIGCCARIVNIVHDTVSGAEPNDN